MKAMSMEESPLTVLREIYADVVAWLHFGEAKNAALATLNLAAIIGAATVYFQEDKVPIYVDIGLAVASALFFLSCVICIVSFMPRLTLFKQSGARSKAETDNVWFFGHIAHMGLEIFLAKLWEKSAFPGAPSQLERDLAQQIVVNSKIAARKYEMFRISLWLSLGGIVTPIGALLLYWFFIDEAV